MAPKSKKKPLWIVEKERQKSAGSAETVWLFGLHAVRDALAPSSGSILTSAPIPFTVFLFKAFEYSVGNFPYENCIGSDTVLFPPSVLAVLVERTVKPLNFTSK